jgi:hypothetical protein
MNADLGDSSVELGFLPGEFDGILAGEVVWFTGIFGSGTRALRK